MRKKTKEVDNWRAVAERQNILRAKLDECKRLRNKFISELEVEERKVKDELKELNNLWDNGYVG